MPNHVKTVIKFKNLKPEDVINIVNRITSKDTEDVLGYYIDFDKIIPEPKTKDECPDKYILATDDFVTPPDDRPWFNWYKWRMERWGSKWNAYDAYTQIGLNSIVFVFSTAWAPVLHIFEKLSELNYDMEIRYANECLGHDCGLYKYIASEHDWDIHDESTMTNPKTFAKRLWDKY